MAKLNISTTERAATVRWARRELAKHELIEFAQFTDTNAASSYGSPHLRSIAERLEAVERGEVKRLFITCPPRHWKSSLACEKFPQWYLGRNPERSIICVSHSANLSTGFSRTVRNNVSFNPRFAEVFPDVRVRDDSSAVHDWALTTAYRSSFRSIGVLGSPTGKGANLILIDDPVKDRADAYNRLALQNTYEWYKETLRDRLEPGGAIVLIMSRWSTEDLAGKLIAASKNGDGEKWEELRLPALADANDPLGRGQGDALWPDRFPLDALMASKQAMGGRAFEARYQGNPRSLEGNILDSSALDMVDACDVPPLMKIVRRWDLAFSETKGADYLAGAKIGVTFDGKVFILHVERVNGRWPKGKAKIKEVAKRDGAEVIVAIEANGTQLGYYQDIKDDAEMLGHVVVPDVPEGSKEMRASMWGTRLEDGIIKCVRGPWNGMLFDEMDTFAPNCEHDDIVDSVSGGYLICVSNLMNKPTVVEQSNARTSGASMPRYSRTRF
jgi:predicted phage terminase large subunit-like protein